VQAAGISPIITASGCALYKYTHRPVQPPRERNQGNPKRKEKKNITNKTKKRRLEIHGIVFIQNEKGIH
jgi:hypothetical protein